MPAIIVPSVAGTIPSVNTPIIQRGSSALASPLVSMAGANALFTLPSGTITLPPGIIPAHSRLRFQAVVQKTGANGTANLDLYLGTAGTSADSRVCRIAFAITTGHLIFLDTGAWFGTSTTTAMSVGKMGANVSGTDNQFGDINTNLNTLATMYLNLGLNSANASDTFAVLYYKAWIENL